MLINSRISLFTISFLIHFGKNTAATTNGSVYTRQGTEAIGKFRPMVKQYLTLDYQTTDAYHLRWLRSTNFDLTTATVNLQKNHQWRKENNIDSILNKDEFIPKDLPYNVDGVDKDGRPVVVLYCGKWNLRRYLLAHKIDILIRQYLRLWEEGTRRIFLMAAQEGKDIDQLVVLMDLNGYNLREHACLGCVPLMSTFINMYYYGTNVFAKSIFLVNVPTSFNPIIRLGKSIVKSPAIRDFNHNRDVWLPELLKEISKDQLPTTLGGTMKRRENRHNNVTNFR